MAVSIKDIAREIGVSETTVSMALRDHPRISVERRRQIKDLAKRLNYRPNAVARAMRMQKSQSIGLLIVNLRTHISNLKAEAIEACMVAANYQVLVGFTQNEYRRTAEYVQNMIAHQVDGLLIMVGGGPAEYWPPLADILRNAPIPCVLVDFAFRTGFPEVCVDRAAGMEKVAAHLIRLGHRSIACVRTESVKSEKWAGLMRGVAAEPSVRLRWASLRKPGWHEEGQAANPDRTDEGLVKFDPLAIEELVARKAGDVAAWPDRPTAVVMFSDTLAMAFINGLHRAGLRVPQDISVTGFDDADEARFFDPALTTVHQPREEVGQKAADMLLRLMRQKRNVNGDAERILLVPELVVRNSTAPADSSKNKA